VQQGRDACRTVWPEQYGRVECVGRRLKTALATGVALRIGIPATGSGKPLNVPRIEGLLRNLAFEKELRSTTQGSRKGSKLVERLRRAQLQLAKRLRGQGRCRYGRIRWAVGLP